MRFEVVYSPTAAQELRSHRARLQRIVETVVDQQLTGQATIEARNRFPMRPNLKAAWELRAEPMRVYYDVDGNTVRIKGVVEKVGAQVRVHNRLMELDEYLAK